MDKSLNITASSIGAAEPNHTHSRSQITDFPTSLPASDVYSWAKSSTKPSYTWNEIGSKPTSFTPSGHMHSKSQITDFPTSMPANGGNADTLGGNSPASFVITATNTIPNNDFNKAIRSGMYRYPDKMLNGPGFDWSQVIVSRGADTVAQIAVCYNDAIMKFRGGNPPEVNGNGKWYNWAEVIDRSRFNPSKISAGTPPSDCLWAW